MSSFERFRDYLTPLVGDDAAKHAEALMALLESPGERGDDPLGLVAMGLELLPPPEVARRIDVTGNMLKFLMRPPGPMRRKVRYARVNGRIVFSVADAALAIEEHRPMIAAREAQALVQATREHEARAAKEAKEAAPQSTRKKAAR